jgi:hypothetical protein
MLFTLNKLYGILSDPIYTLFTLLMSHSYLILTISSYPIFLYSGGIDTQGSKQQDLRRQQMKLKLKAKMQAGDSTEDYSNEPMTPKTAGVKEVKLHFMPPQELD